MDPLTQGQQAAAEGAAVDASQVDQGSQASAAPAVPPGVQQRFDEMTARFRDQERVTQQLTMQNQQLMQNLMAQQQRQQAAAVAQPPPLNIDPDQQALLDAYANARIAPQLQQMQSQFQSFQQQMAAQMAGMRVNSSVPTGLDPRVSERAQAIVGHYAQQGVVKDPLEAVDLAIGQLTREGVSVAAASNQARQAANAQIPPNMGAGGARTPAPQGGGFQVVSPETLDSWSPAKQMAYHEQVLRIAEKAPLFPNTDDWSSWQ